VELTTLALLLAQIAAILLLSRGLGFVMRALGQPLVMAEMIAGILLGPSLLGRVAPQAMATLFPASSMPVLKTLSQLGLVLFMFVIGLELDSKVLKERRGASVLISHVSIFFPFVLGLGAAARTAYTTPCSRLGCRRLSSRSCCSWRGRCSGASARAWRRAAGSRRPSWCSCSCS